MAGLFWYHLQADIQTDGTRKSCNSWRNFEIGMYLVAKSAKGTVETPVDIKEI